MQFLNRLKNILSSNKILFAISLFTIFYVLVFTVLLPQKCKYEVNTKNIKGRIIDYKIDGDYLVFKTTHLSEYGIIATNTANSSNNTNNTNNVSNPKTSDNIVMYVAMACVSIIGMGVLSINIKRK